MAVHTNQDNRRSLLQPSRSEDGESPISRRVSERFRRENPQHIRSFLSIAVARVSSRVARSMPTPLRYWSADRLGDIMYALSPGYRINVRSNLSHVYRAMGLSEPTERDIRKVYRVSSRNWADLLITPKRTVEQFDSDFIVTPGSLSNLDDAIALGKGVVIITAHVGAFDYLGHFLHAHGYKLTIVTGRTTARIVFDGVTYLRQSNGLALVEATASGVRKAIQTVMQGNCAVIVTDRDFFQNGVPVTFFGDETTLPPGAVRIARDTGASIVPVFGMRVGNRQRITIHPGFTIPKTSDGATDVKTGMDQMVSVMETALQEAPDQWVMFQSVWPLERDEGDA